MANVTLPHTLVAGTPENVNDVQANFTELANKINGSIDTDNLSATTQASLVPAGTILATGRSTAATGYLMCDGSAVSRATYADLFSAIGTAYGSGDGSTTFNVPDLRGRVATGKGSQSGVANLGDSEGAAVANRRTTHTHTTPAHSHDYTHGHTFSGTTSTYSSGANTDGTGGFGTTDPHSHTFSGSTSTQSATTTGTASPTTNDGGPSYVVVNYMVKT